MSRFRPDVPRRNRKFARDLRRAPTRAEAIAWHFLRSRRFDGARFRRQVPIGGYIVDFASVQYRIVIELDGGQHDERRLLDEERTRFLESRGFLVLRFWNVELLQQRDEVLGAIWAAVQARKGAGAG